MVESGRVPKKGRIRATIEKHSGRVSDKSRISVSTKKMVESGRVPGKGRIRATIENCPDEFRKMVESVREPKNCSDLYLKTLESV